MILIAHTSILVCFYVLACVLHFTGIVLLRKHSVDISETQKMLLINLSISEILSCSLALMQSLTYFYPQLMLTYVSINVLTPFCLFSYFAYLTIMTAIALDRFAKFYFNIRYSLYWSTRRTKYFLLIIWAMEFSVALLLFLYCYIFKMFFNVYKILIAYILPIACAVTLTVFIFSYGYIIRVLFRHKSIHSHQTRVSVKGNPNQTNGKDQTCTNISSLVLKARARFILKERKKHLLLPTLLILTFIIFVMVPAYLQMDLLFDFPFVNIDLYHVCVYVAYCGVLSDAVIYLLLSTKPGRIYLQKICRVAKRD